MRADVRGWRRSSQDDRQRKGLRILLWERGGRELGCARRTVVVPEDVGDRIYDDQADGRLQAPALDECGGLVTSREVRALIRALPHGTAGLRSSLQRSQPRWSRLGQKTRLLEDVPEMRRSIDRFLDEDALLERLLRGCRRVLSREADCVVVQTTDCAAHTCS